MSERTMPVSEYCEAIETWARIIVENAEAYDRCACGHAKDAHRESGEGSCWIRGPANGQGWRCTCEAWQRHDPDAPEPHGYSYARVLPDILLDIHKSNLLARLIYGGEALREERCPKHDGRWSGIGPCPHGCGSTGWVPDDWPDEAPRCTEHPDRPAVTVEVSVGSTRNLCYDC